MPYSKLSVALAALLAASLTTPAYARSGGGGGGHSGGHGARGSSGGHAHSHSGGSAPRRNFFGRARTGFFLGAPVYAWAWAYHYRYPAPLAPMPPIEYIEKPPEGTMYFCPAANGYYPAVPQCPSGWVQAQPLWAWPPPAPAANPFEGAWSPLGPLD